VTLRTVAPTEGRKGMMRIVERKVSAGDREIFDLDEFLSRPLYAHLAHVSGHGPRDSPVWFHWDGRALWIIGGTSFPENLRREPRCAVGIVDWNPASGLSQHVGLRGRAEVLAFDSAVARTIFKKYLGPDEGRWDPRFPEDIKGETGVPLIQFTPETVVLRDQSYTPPRSKRTIT
jgi:Pyridoxamine 5'-phosphate oxidase